jgi:hypothetical protein
MQTSTLKQPKTELPQLIEREILFGNPEKTSPRLSPDGKYLAYIAPDENNVLQVQLRIVGQQDDRQLTADKKRGIRIFFWTYSGEELIYLQDADGDENWHIFSVNIHSNQVRDLTPFQGVQAQQIAFDRNFPNEILVGLISPLTQNTMSATLSYTPPSERFRQFPFTRTSKSGRF